MKSDASILRQCPCPVESMVFTLIGLFTRRSSHEGCHGKLRFLYPSNKILLQISWTLYYLTSILGKYTMEVNGAPELLCFLHSSEYLPLCSAEQIYAYRFGTTWGCTHDDRTFIFGWTIPLICLIIIFYHFLFHLSLYTSQLTFTFHSLFFSISLVLSHVVSLCLMSSALVSSHVYISHTVSSVLFLICLISCQFNSPFSSYFRLHNSSLISLFSLLTSLVSFPLV